MKTNKNFGQQRTQWTNYLYTIYLLIDVIVNAEGDRLSRDFHQLNKYNLRERWSFCVATIQESQQKVYCFIKWNVRDRLVISNKTKTSVSGVG